MKKWRNKLFFHSALLIVAVCALKLIASPFILVFALLCLALSFELVYQAASSEPAQALYMALGVSVALLLGESGLVLYSLVDPDIERQVSLLSGENAFMTAPHPILGFAPRPNQRIRWRKLKGQQVVYDVNLTIDGTGRRINGEQPGSPSGCVWFFGGSYTFGAGVEDHETLPAQFALQSSSELQVENFGFSSYGPHQMLASLEFGLAEKMAQCRPQHVLFQLIPHHTVRMTPRVPWRRDGPLYSLAADGSLNYQGQFFDSAPIRVFSWLSKHLQRSRVFDRTLQLLWQLGRGDAELLVQIIAHAQAHLEQNYPEAQFHVLYWDESSEVAQELKQRLLAQNFKLYLVSEMLGLEGVNRSPDYIIEHDGHPNSKVYKVLAEKLLNKLDLEQDQRESRL